jgi:fumarate hydratase class II
MKPSGTFRAESDPLGEIPVPAEALWGAQTQRAVENFPVSGQTIPRRIIRALALIKRGAATVNREHGALPGDVADAIVKAADEVAAGGHDDQFPVDVFQTGSGTSTHMNVNEVIANRAIQLLGGQVGTKKPVHPNDHVNLGQSSNDVFPTAAHVAAAESAAADLLPALRELERSLADKAAGLAHVIKIGRTHLQDAVPIGLGQELTGYATMVANATRRIEAALPAVHELALGGTAVGTGFGSRPGFAQAVIERLRADTGLPFVQAPNLCEALGARDALVALSAALRGAAIGLTKIANDIRWLASGPRCGLGELKLPSLQAGSSLMPGKVNPVMAEMLLMVAAQVVGNDATVAWAGAGGVLELNAMIPVIAFNVLRSIEMLGNGCRLFARRCVAGIEADEARCRELVERSLSLGTALLPRLGYDRAAAVVYEAAASGKTIRQICREQNLIEAAELDQLLDPRAMTEPREPPGGHDVRGSGA